MKYTYQEISESGNWSMPQPEDVHHASSKKELRRALEGWADQNERYNDRRDASLMVWKGTHEDVTDLYPDFVLKVGPRGGAIFELC